MRWPYLIPVALVTVMVAVLAVGLTRDPRRVPSPLIGKPAPEFSVPTLDGNGRLSRADLLGQVSVVNVWASWCLACRDEHPVLMELARMNLVPIYGLDYKDERAAARHWLRRYGNPYHTIAFDASGDMGIDWGVYGVPETFVIDRNGVIRRKFIGAMSSQDLREELVPLVRRLQREG